MEPSTRSTNKADAINGGLMGKKLKPKRRYIVSLDNVNAIPNSLEICAVSPGEMQKMEERGKQRRISNYVPTVLKFQSPDRNKPACRRVSTTPSEAGDVLNLEPKGSYDSLPLKKRHSRHRKLSFDDSEVVPCVEGSEREEDPLLVIPVEKEEEDLQVVLTPKDDSTGMKKKTDGAEARKEGKEMASPREVVPIGAPTNAAEEASASSSEATDPGDALPKVSSTRMALAVNKPRGYHIDHSATRPFQQHPRRFTPLGAQSQTHDSVDDNGGPAAPWKSQVMKKTADKYKYWILDEESKLSSQDTNGNAKSRGTKTPTRVGAPIVQGSTLDALNQMTAATSPTEIAGTLNSVDTTKAPMGGAEISSEGEKAPSSLAVPLLAQAGVLPKPPAQKCIALQEASRKASTSDEAKAPNVLIAKPPTTEPTLVAQPAKQLPEKAKEMPSRSEGEEEGKLSTESWTAVESNELQSRAAQANSSKVPGKAGGTGTEAPSMQTEKDSKVCSKDKSTAVNSKEQSKTARKGTCEEPAVTPKQSGKKSIPGSTLASLQHIQQNSSSTRKFNKKRQATPGSVVKTTRKISSSQRPTTKTPCPSTHSASKAGRQPSTAGPPQLPKVPSLKRTPPPHAVATMRKDVGTTLKGPPSTSSSARPPHPPKVPRLKWSPSPSVVADAGTTQNDSQPCGLRPAQPLKVPRLNWSPLPSVVADAGRKEKDPQPCGLLTNPPPKVPPSKWASLPSVVATTQNDAPRVGSAECVMQPLSSQAPQPILQMPRASPPSEQCAPFPAEAPFESNPLLPAPPKTKTTESNGTGREEAKANCSDAVRKSIIPSLSQAVTGCDSHGSQSPGTLASKPLRDTADVREYSEDINSVVAKERENRPNTRVQLVDYIEGLPATTTHLQNKWNWEESKVAYQKEQARQEEAAFQLEASTLLIDLAYPPPPESCVSSEEQMTCSTIRFKLANTVWSQSILMTPQSFEHEVLEPFKLQRAAKKDGGSNGLNAHLTSDVEDSNKYDRLDIIGPATMVREFESYCSDWLRTRVAETHFHDLLADPWSLRIDLWVPSHYMGTPVEIKSHGCTLGLWVDPDSQSNVFWQEILGTVPPSGIAITTHGCYMDGEECYGDSRQENLLSICASRSTDLSALDTSRVVGNIYTVGNTLALELEEPIHYTDPNFLQNSTVSHPDEWEDASLSHASREEQSRSSKKVNLSAGQHATANGEPSTSDDEGEAWAINDSTNQRSEHKQASKRSQALESQLCRAPQEDHRAPSLSTGEARLQESKAAVGDRELPLSKEKANSTSSIDGTLVQWLDEAQSLCSLESEGKQNRLSQVQEKGAKKQRKRKRLRKLSRHAAVLSSATNKQCASSDSFYPPLSTSATFYRPHKRNTSANKMGRFARGDGLKSKLGKVPLKPNVYFEDDESSGSDDGRLSVVSWNRSKTVARNRASHRSHALAADEGSEADDVSDNQNNTASVRSCDRNKIAADHKTRVQLKEADPIMKQRGSQALAAYNESESEEEPMEKPKNKNAFQPSNNANNAPAKLSFDAFKRKMKPVYELEFEPFGIEIQFAMKTMWKSHKQHFGKLCDESCSCIWELSLLTKNVCEKYLSEELRKQPHWIPPPALRDLDLDETPTSFSTNFARKFTPLLRGKDPNEGPTKILERLVFCWRKHLKQLNFGDSCPEHCSCLEAWQFAFNEGDMCETRPAKKRRPNLLAPLAPLQDNGHSGAHQSEATPPKKKTEKATSDQQPRRLSRHAFCFDFSALQPLGFVVTTSQEEESSKKWCTIASVYKAESNKEAINADTIVEAIEHLKQGQGQQSNLKFIESHGNLKLHYMAAARESRSGRLRVWFSNPNPNQRLKKSLQAGSWDGGKKANPPSKQDRANETSASTSDGGQQAGQSTLEPRQHHEHAKKAVPHEKALSLKKRVAFDDKIFYIDAEAQAHPAKRQRVSSDCSWAHDRVKEEDEPKQDECDNGKYLLHLYLECCHSKTNKWQSQATVESNFYQKGSFTTKREVRIARTLAHKSSLVEYGRQALILDGKPVVPCEKKKTGFSSMSYLRLSAAGVTALAQKPKEETDKEVLAMIPKKEEPEMLVLPTMLREEASHDILRLFLGCLNQEWTAMAQLEPAFFALCGTQSHQMFVETTELASNRSFIAWGKTVDSLACVSIQPRPANHEALEGSTRWFLRLTSSGKSWVEGAQPHPAVSAQPPVCSDPAWFLTGGMSRQKCKYFVNTYTPHCIHRNKCQYLHQQPRLGPSVDVETLLFKKLTNILYLEKQGWYTSAYHDRERNIFYVAEWGKGRLNEKDGVWWYRSKEDARLAVERVFTASQLHIKQIRSLSLKAASQAQRPQVCLAPVPGHYGPNLR